MTTIYQHMKPDERVLHYCRSRRAEIRKEVEQLQTEAGMLDDIERQFIPLACPECSGEGFVMRLIAGCEIDGPRMHKCEVCGGTGKPSPSTVGEKP